MSFFNENKIYLAKKLFYSVFRMGKRIIFAPSPELKKEQQYFKRALIWTFPLRMRTLDAAKIHKGKNTY